MGRLLITLLLSVEGVLREPLLYLSLFLKQHRETYYELLQKVRIEGDWEAWLDFFFQGVTETSDSAVSTAQRLLQLFAEDRKRIQANGKIAGSVLQVHHYLQGRPITSASAIGDAENLSAATVNKALKALTEMFEIDHARATIAIEVMGDWESYDDPALSLIIRLLKPVVLKLGERADFPIEPLTNPAQDTLSDWLANTIIANEEQIRNRRDGFIKLPEI